jgi:hypothetical protein
MTSRDCGGGILTGLHTENGNGPKRSGSNLLLNWILFLVSIHFWIHVKSVLFVDIYP